MSRYFTVLRVITRYHNSLNAEGRGVTERMAAPTQVSASAPVPEQYFANSVDELFE